VPDNAWQSHISGNIWFRVWYLHFTCYIHRVHILVAPSVLAGSAEGAPTSGVHVPRGERMTGTLQNPAILARTLLTPALISWFNIRAVILHQGSSCFSNTGAARTPHRKTITKTLRESDEASWPHDRLSLLWVETAPLTNLWYPDASYFHERSQQPNCSVSCVVVTCELLHTAPSLADLRRGPWTNMRIYGGNQVKRAVLNCHPPIRSWAGWGLGVGGHTRIWFTTNLEFGALARSHVIY
jgi:hypothetical protein